MARQLVVTCDGAGSFSADTGIARALVERGHAVRVIGHKMIGKICRDGAPASSV